MNFSFVNRLFRLSVLLWFLTVILTSGCRHCRLVGSMWMTPLEHEAQMSFHIQLFTIPIPRNGFWWAQVESNHRPHAYQACALTFWAMSPCYLHNHRYRLNRRSVSLNLIWFRFFNRWWRWRDSNPWPPACRAGALPTELHPHIWGKKEKWIVNSFIIPFSSFSHNRIPSGMCNAKACFGIESLKIEQQL